MKIRNRNSVRNYMQAEGKAFKAERERGGGGGGGERGGGGEGGGGGRERYGCLSSSGEKFHHEKIKFISSNHRVIFFAFQSKKRQMTSSILSLERIWKIRHRLFSSKTLASILYNK